MKIVKSTERPTERALVSFAEGVKEVPQKLGSFFSNARNRSMMIICAVFLVAAAVVLNVALFSGGAQAESGVKDETGDAPTAGQEESDESYFALATLDRRQAREEALEVLQLIVDSTDAAGEEKEEARQSISRIAEEIEMESNVETLIKAKGFSDCVAVISNGKANVIVATPETLLPNQIAQIKEILYTRAEILPANTTIIERITQA